MGLLGASKCTCPPQLPPALQLHILSLLPPNDRAHSGRLVSPDAAAALSNSGYCTASLSQPLPPHAAPWAVEAGQQHVRQLTFRHKLQLLCTAAASGSEVNLEVAWALLQPSVFSEVLLQPTLARIMLPSWYGTPGVAAVRAGHPQLLGWLLRRCPALVDRIGVLGAAARYCDLKGLQTAWGLLQPSGISGHGNARLLFQQLDAAAESATPDAVAKMEWVLETAGEGACHLQRSTAVAAARSGDLGRLRWLRDRGCPMGGMQVLESALQHADRAVAQWLVDEAGCALPAAGCSSWTSLQLAAAKSATGGAAKLAWLQERRASQVEGNARLFGTLVSAALGQGQVEVLQLLPGLWTPAGQEILRREINTATRGWVAAPWSLPMAKYLHEGGFVFGHEAYTSAALSGDIAMVRWLAGEVGVSAVGLRLERFIIIWPDGGTQDSRERLEAVQLVVGEAGCRDWDAQRVLNDAVWRGDLALVQYLLQQRQGFRPDWWHLMFCASTPGGSEALLEWLVATAGSSLVSAADDSPYLRPAKRGDRGTLAALRRLGVPWGAEDVVKRAVEWDCAMPTVRWLVEQGAPMGDLDRLESAVARAVQQGSVTVEEAAWLRSMAAARAAAEAAEAAVGKV